MSPSATPWRGSRRLPAPSHPAPSAPAPSAPAPFGGPGSPARRTAHPTTSHRLLLVTAAAVILVAVVPEDGRTLYSPHGRIVSPDPADHTPHVLDGKVTAILPMGGRVYVGGTFTQVRDAAAGPTEVLARHGLFALDPATGRVDRGFVAQFDRDVEALAADPAGDALFVGGDFGSLNGVPERKLAKISAATGSPVPGFSVSVHSPVNDLVVVGRRLFLGGAFSEVNGRPRGHLAAVDVTTGDLDPSVDLPFSEPRVGGSSRVEALAATPDGSTLVVAGNFLRAGGARRGQLALLDIGARPARLVDWHTERYDPRDPVTGRLGCSAFWETMMRDVDVSPDGTYFVVVTTGGFDRGNLCDTAARWETGGRGGGLQPSWVSDDGGDSFTGVAITGEAVYVGGHPRWLNNPQPVGVAGGNAGPGAVPREGIAALDPQSGLPLASWNPGRDRGEGAWALVSTPDGLWVGSDTDRIGGEYHGKLSFFPLAGGAPAPRFAAPRLPGDLYRPGADGALARRPFDGLTAGPQSLHPAPVDWSLTRGAFMAGARLYTGQADGTLVSRPFDGLQVGPSTPVDLRGLTAQHFPLARLTGMFLDAGHLYYTVQGDRRLYARTFLPETRPEDDVVGASARVVSGESDGLDWSAVRGLTMVDGRIYWAAGGDLHRIDFRAGRPVPGTAAVVARGALGGPFDALGLFVVSGPGVSPTVPPGPVVPSTVPAPPPPGLGAPGPGPAPPGAPSRLGYWMMSSDGLVHAFGDAPSLGDAGRFLGDEEAVDLEPTPTGDGYWIVDRLGRITTFGDARQLGHADTRRLAPGESVTSLSATPAGWGYWLFTSRGRALAFGDARHYGDVSTMTLNGPVLDSIPTPSGGGYYMVASDGGIFAFGDARFRGSMGGRPLNAPVQSLVPDRDGAGYWLVASDGGVFAFEAPFRGSMGDRRLNRPVTGMVPYGDGYLMVGEDGGIFNFSDRPFAGSLGSRPPARPVVSVAVLEAG